MRARDRYAKIRVNDGKWFVAKKKIKMNSNKSETCVWPLSV